MYNRQNMGNKYQFCREIWLSTDDIDINNMAVVYGDEENFLRELVGDEDSESEFEGFDEADVGEEDGRDFIDRENDILEEWEVGDISVRTERSFTSLPGLRAPVEELKEPLDYLNLFIKDDDYDEIATETNRYAKEFLQQNRDVLKPKSRFWHWCDTSGKEIKVFLYLTIAMGLIMMQDIQDYWSTDPVVSTPFFPSVMSRDRFLIIMSFFHLCNNAEYIARGVPGHNPVRKLGHVFSNMISRFGSVFVPNRYLSLDEGMIPWRGKLAFRVYNPDKPIKYGIKSYMVCDSTNGYCSKFQLYVGKTNVPVSENGKTYDLTMDMMRNFFGQGYTLFMDSYYSSPRLFLDLWDLGISAIGTVRSTRKGILQTLKDKKLTVRQETYTMHTGPLVAMKYNDRKQVILLGTTGSAQNVQTGKSDPKTGLAIERPDIVNLYDKYMGGVDRSDQMVSYQCFNSRTLKWWKKVFFHMLNLTVLNAYILYKISSPDAVKMPQRVFRRKLISQIVETAGFVAEIHRGRTRPSGEVLLRLEGRHFLSKITNENSEYNQKMCVVCGQAEKQMLASKGIQKRRAGRTTTMKCGQSDMPLCVTPCFEIYHTKKEYIVAYKRMRLAQNNDE